MNNDVKISLTINMEGSRQEYLGVEKKPFKLMLRDINPNAKKDRVIKKGTYTVPVYKTSVCKQKINMGESAYEYFISNEIPEWAIKSPTIINELGKERFKAAKLQKYWSSADAEKRLAIHMEWIASSYNSTDYQYEILE